jgi:integrase
VPPNLSLSALDGIERAALALVAAVQAARGNRAAPDFSLSHSHAAKSIVTVANEFLVAKARAGRADSYLRVTLAQLKAFAQIGGGRALGSIGAEEIEAWAHGQKWSPVTIRNHILTVRTLFAFAVSRGYVVGNPALAVDVPEPPQAPPAIHAPEQVAAVLETARGANLSLCRWLAVRYFAGLRGSEAATLTEAQIQPGRGFIEVTAERAKTRRRRIVRIEPALAAWLDIGGTLPLTDVNTKLWRLTGALPFAFPKNVTRHSFVSYHLAAFGSASKTALEAGHTEQILFNHYREVVTPDAAAAFWSLRPQ